MKNILVTGKNSYIGTSVGQYLSQWADRYWVTPIDLKNPTWKQESFAGYDVVFHVAGIAHSDTGHVSRERIDFYYKINTELAIETAKKAKDEGVKQFIFMSSSIVYGDSSPIKKDKHITKDTPVCPANFYGDSKVQAEKGLKELETPDFKVVILRPPMIYGKGSKGNYPLLSRIAQKLPLFPKVENHRSMLYIGNLAEFVRLMVENEETGTFWPQNAEYSNTSKLVKDIAAVHGKKIFLVPGCSLFLQLLGKLSKRINKAFGNFTYDHSLSYYPKGDYQLHSLMQSVQLTEK